MSENSIDLESLILEDKYWKEKEGTSDENGKIPTFPIDIFPDVIREFITEVSEKMPCSIDYLGAFILATYSTIIGNTRIIKVKEKFEQTCSLYIAVVGEPSTKKSPAMSICLLPIMTLQKKYNVEYQEKKKAYKKDEISEKPILKQLYTTDATIEAIGSLLYYNKRGILLKLDELSSWVGGMNQYKGGKGSDKQKWLSIWSSDPIIINRKNEDPISIDTPYITVAGGIQPDLLKSFNSKDKDGFINRILFSYPEPVRDHWTDKQIRESIINNYLNHFEGLTNYLFHDQEEEIWGAEDSRLTLEMAPNARKCFGIYYEKLCKEMADDSINSLVKASLGKLQGYTARFSLLLQIMHYNDSRVIEEKYVNAAISLSEYFKAHMYKVFSAISKDPETAKIERSIKWIEKNAINGKVRLRDIYTNKVDNRKTKPEALELLKLLESKGHGVINEIKPPRGGRLVIEFTLFE